MLSLLTAMPAPEASAAGGGSMMTTFITFGLIIAIFYFLIIRPQKKREKETKEMLASIKKGDRVVSIGGIHGTVMIVKETTVVIKVDDNTRIEFSRNAISSIVDRKSDAPTARKKAKKTEEVAVVEAEEVVAVEAEEVEEKSEK
jgi:preprotein translocase subunit YajC